MSRLYCPTGCGSRSFRVQRKGVLVVDVEIDEETGALSAETGFGEAGGQAWVSCECGHHWPSRHAEIEDLARFMEGNL